jgi:hypothetical protein
VCGSGTTRLFVWYHGWPILRLGVHFATEYTPKKDNHHAISLIAFLLNTPRFVTFIGEFHNVSLYDEKLRYIKKRKQ